MVKKIKTTKAKEPKIKKLPGIIGLIKLALRPIKLNRNLFLGFILLQFGLNIIFVIGVDSIYDFPSIKQDAQENLEGSAASYNQSFALLNYVLAIGSNGANSSYQFFIILISSLAVIWAIRQVLAKQKITLKQSFYEGVYPLVPFFLVFLVIGLQLIPLLAGNFLLATVIANNLAVSALEQIFWWAVFILLALVSLYMVVSSIFALYIATLPDMTPLKALKSARGLVRGRRFSIGVRLLILPILTLLLYIIVLIPLINFLPILVVPIFALLGGFALFFVHSYIYNLYRELL